MHLGGLSIDYFCHPCKLPYLRGLWECCSSPFEIFQEHRISPTEGVWKKYLLKGVMKVVCLALSSSNGVCQNPVAASNCKNVLEPASLGNIPSRVGKMGGFFIEVIQTNTYSHSAIFSWYWYPWCTPLSQFCYVFNNPTFDYSLQLFLQTAMIEFGAAPFLSLIFTGIVLKSSTGSWGGLNTSSTFCIRPMATDTDLLSRLFTTGPSTCWNRTLSLCNKWRPLFVSLPPGQSNTAHEHSSFDLVLRVS